MAMRFYSWWQTCLVAIALGVATTMPLATFKAPGLVVLPSIREWIDVLAVLVSWPVAGTFIAFYFANAFHAPIYEYLKRIGPIKIWNVELQPAQTVPENSNLEDIDANLSSSTDLQARLHELAANLDTTETQKQVLEQTIDVMASESLKWKFKYLDLFLVEYTKRVLQWLAASPQYRPTYDYVWQYVIHEQQRAIVVGVLSQFGLITETNGVLEITPQGRTFVAFIGTEGTAPSQPLPSIAPPFVPVPPPPPPPNLGSLLAGSTSPTTPSTTPYANVPGIMGVRPSSS